MVAAAAAAVAHSAAPAAVALASATHQHWFGSSHIGVPHPPLVSARYTFNG